MDQVSFEIKVFATNTVKARVGASVQVFQPDPVPEFDHSTPVAVFRRSNEIIRRDIQPFYQGPEGGGISSNQFLRRKPLRFRSQNILERVFVGSCLEPDVMSREPIMPRNDVGLDQL